MPPFITMVLTSGKNSVFSSITLHLTFYSRFNIVFFVISFYITLYTMVVTQQSHRKNFSTFFIFCEKIPQSCLCPEDWFLLLLQSFRNILLLGVRYISIFILQYLFVYPARQNFASVY